MAAPYFNSTGSPPSLMGGTLDKICVAVSSAVSTAAASSKAMASPPLIRFVPVTNQPSARKVSARREAV